MNTSDPFLTVSCDKCRAAISSDTRFEYLCGHIICKLCDDEAGRCQYCGHPGPANSLSHDASITYKGDICEACDDTALYYCVTCPKLLCERCAHIHSETIPGARKDHQVIYLKDYPRQIPSEDQLDRVNYDVPENVYLPHKRSSDNSAEDQRPSPRKKKAIERTDTWDRTSDLRKPFRKNPPVKQFSYSKSMSSRASSVQSIHEMMENLSNPSYDNMSYKSEKSVGTDISGTASMIRNNNFTIMVYANNSSPGSVSSSRPGKISITRNVDPEDTPKLDCEKCPSTKSAPPENGDCHNHGVYIERRASQLSNSDSIASFSSHVCEVHVSEYTSRDQSFVSKSDTFDSISDIMNQSDNRSGISPRVTSSPNPVIQEVLEADAPQDEVFVKPKEIQLDKENHDFIVHKSPAPSTPDATKQKIDDLLEKYSTTSSKSSSKSSKTASLKSSSTASAVPSEVDQLLDKYDSPKMEEVVSLDSESDDDLQGSASNISLHFVKSDEEPCMVPRKSPEREDTHPSPLIERVRRQSNPTDESFIDEDLYEISDHDEFQNNGGYLTHSSHYSSENDEENLSEIPEEPSNEACSATEIAEPRIEPIVEVHEVTGEMVFMEPSDDEKDEVMMFEVESIPDEKDDYKEIVVTEEFVTTINSEPDFVDSKIEPDESIDEDSLSVRSQRSTRSSTNKRFSYAKSDASSVISRTESLRSVNSLSERSPSTSPGKVPSLLSESSSESVDSLHADSDTSSSRSNRSTLSGDSRRIRTVHDTDTDGRYMTTFEIPKSSSSCSSGESYPKAEEEILGIDFTDGPEMPPKIVRSGSEHSSKDSDRQSARSVSSVNSKKSNRSRHSVASTKSEKEGSQMSTEGQLEPLRLTRIPLNKSMHVIIGTEGDEADTLYFPTMVEYRRWSLNQSILDVSSEDGSSNGFFEAIELDNDDQPISKELEQEILYKYAKFKSQESLTSADGNGERRNGDDIGEKKLIDILDIDEMSITSSNRCPSENLMDVWSVEDLSSTSSTSTIVDEDEFIVHSSAPTHPPGYFSKKDRASLSSRNSDLPNIETELERAESLISLSSSLHSGVGKDYIGHYVNKFHGAMEPGQQPVEEPYIEFDRFNRKYSKRISALGAKDAQSLPRPVKDPEPSRDIRQTYTLPRKRPQDGGLTNFLNQTYAGRGPRPKSNEGSLLYSRSFGSMVNDQQYQKFPGIEDSSRTLPRHLGRKPNLRCPSMRQVDWSIMGKKGTEPGFLMNPSGIAVDEGCVAICEEGNGRIQLFINDESEYCINNISNPCGIALSPDNIFVSDIDTNVVQIYGRNALGKAVLGGPGSQRGRFNEPRGIAINQANGDLAVCDTENHRVQIFDANCNYVMAIGGKGKNKGEFREPIGCTYDRWGRLLVSDHCNYRVQIFDNNYQYITEFGKYGKGSGEFWGVNGICSHGNGDILVVDSDNNCLSVHSSDGRFISVFGRRGQDRWEFLYPHSVSSDEEGNVYVSDWGNHRIHIMDKKLLPYLELESHML